MRALAGSIAEGCEMTVEAILLDEVHPSTANQRAQSEFALVVAGAGRARWRATMDAPAMGSEDFAFMHKEKPGRYLLIGNGDIADLHNSAYDFNNETAPKGAALFAQIAEDAPPVPV